MPSFNREIHLRNHVENQFCLIKKMLETEMPRLRANLRFNTPFEEHQGGQKFVPKKKELPQSLQSDGSVFNVYKMKAKSCGYYDTNEAEYPFLSEKDPNKLTHRIVYVRDGTFSDKIDELLMIKYFAHETRLAHFDIANCFYTMNHDLLPARLREISSRKIWVKNMHDEPERWVIEPRRGLVPCFETCKWFSQVVLNENPYVIAVMVDDCFCWPENIEAAQNWFVERGFEINNKKCSPILQTCIINRMSKLDAKCVCCGKTVKKRELACLGCSVCRECDGGVLLFNLPTCSHCRVSAQFRQVLSLKEGPPQSSASFEFLSKHLEQI